jgi:hypothetical protein
MFAEKRRAAIAVRLITFISNANNRDGDNLIISRTKDELGSK